jgi:hypothetical protein
MGHLLWVTMPVVLSIYMQFMGLRLMLTGFDSGDDIYDDI